MVSPVVRETIILQAEFMNTRLPAATVMLPAFGASDKVYEHHLFLARMELNDFGIADPTTFEAKLQKTG